MKVRCDLITSWNQEIKEIGWEKIGNNIIFQGHLCAVDSGLKRKNGRYIGWTGNCKEKMSSLEKRGIGVCEGVLLASFLYIYTTVQL